MFDMQMFLFWKSTVFVSENTSISPVCRHVARLLHRLLVSTLEKAVAIDTVPKEAQEEAVTGVLLHLQLFPQEDIVAMYANCVPLT